MESKFYKSIYHKKSPCVNKNTLFISSKSLTEAGIREYLTNLITRISETTSFGSDYFQCSMVRKNGEVSNACFVWFTSSKLVNIILGVEESPISIPSYEDEKHTFFEKIVIKRSSIVPHRYYTIDTVFCCHVPEFITQKDIWEEFRRYSVSGGPDGINIIFQEKGDSRQCIIEYEKKTTDGLFAQQMKMFCNIKGEDLLFMMKYKD